MPPKSDNNYITLKTPNRLVDGYGPNLKLMREIQSKNIDLLFSLDCGTNSFEVLNDKEYQDIDIIVIDHHISDFKLPEVYSLINPNRFDETGESKDMLETPQIMDVAVSFRPILKTLPKFGVNEPILLTTPNNRYFNPRPVVETVNRITPRGTFDNSLRGIAESIAENQRPDPFNFGSF